MTTSRYADEIQRRHEALDEAYLNGNPDAIQAHEDRGALLAMLRARKVNIVRLIGDAATPVRDIEGLMP